MPITLKRQLSTAAPAPVPEQGTMQMLRSALGLGTRLAGGFVSNVGGLPGAIAGGGSELLAEGLEGSLDWDTSPYRVATEATIGLVPLGKTITAGRALASLGKGAAFNAAGDVGRQWAEGNFDEGGAGFQPLRTGYAAALGGAVNAAVGHLSPSFERAPKPAVEPKPRGPSPTYKPSARLSGQSLADAESALEHKFSEANTALDARIERDLDKRFAMAMEAGDNRVKGRQAFVDEQDARRQAILKAEQGTAREAERANRARDAYEQEIRRAADEAEQEGRLRELAATLKAERTPDISYSERLKGYTPEGTPASATIRYAEEAEEGVTGGRGGSRSGSGRPSKFNGVEVQPEEVETIINKGMKSPEGSHNRLFAEWLVALDGDIESAAQNAAKGVRPASPERVSQITGKPMVESIAPEVEAPVIPAEPVDPNAYAGWGRFANENDEDLTRLMDDSAIPADPVVEDPLARLLNATVDNPGGSRVPSTDYSGPFNPATGVTDDVPGATGTNWVDEQNAYLDWLGGEDSPSQFRGPKGSKTPAAKPPKPPKEPRIPTTSLTPSLGEERKLQDLLDFLQIDEAYGKADPAARKELGSLFGRSQAQAIASNSPDIADEIAAGIPTGLSPKGERGASATEALLTTALGIGGAGVGAAMDDDDPLRGALIGGTLGAGASMIPRLLQSVNLTPEILQTPEGRKTAAEELLNAIPQFQRFAYLSDVRGLPANAVIGPYGSMMTGALEAALSGDQRGWAVLRNAWNPMTFLKEWNTARQEATTLLREGELGRAEGLTFQEPEHYIPRSLEEANSTFRYGTSIPGVMMTQGDVAARKFLMDAGFSADEARRMTLTGEPQTRWGKDGANLGRSGSSLWNVLFPFKRTPINIAEEGASRIPGLGFGLDYLTDADTTLREQLVKQAGGLGAGVAGYQIGQELDDPRSNAQNFARRGATNFAGRYSLPMTLGILLGQTVGQGKNLTKRDIENGVSQSIPLPGPDALTDTGAYVLGKLGLTSNENPPIPRNLLPFRPFTDSAAEPAQPLSRFSQIRRR
jgi:hypothetical protein